MLFYTCKSKCFQTCTASSNTVNNYYIYVIFRHGVCLLETLKFSTMKFSNVSVLAATSLLINLTNETVSRGEVLALIRARRNADFSMLPRVSEILKSLYQNISYWMMN